MAYQGFSPVQFARSAATTTAVHIRELEEACLRNYQLGALLEASGRVTYNHGGVGFDWPVMYRTHNVEGNTGETPRNFARRNLFKVANQEFRGYQVTDSMYLREFLENRGPEGIVKVYDQFIDRLRTSIIQGMGPEYYVNGDATGRETSWHGFESIFKVNATAQTLNSSTAAARTANQADLVANPEGTYAGINVALGNYGGANESGQVWPNGVADSEYDFWSPLMIAVDSSHTDFPSATNTFAGQGDEALRWGIIHSQRNAGPNAQVTNILMSRDYYLSFLNLQDAKEQVNVESQYSLRAFGFKNVVLFDGVECSWEAAVPTSTAYGFNYNNISLLSMNDQLFRSEGPEYDIHTQAFNACVSTLSNLKFTSPRNFVKWCGYASFATNAS